METLILLVASLFATPTVDATTNYDSSYTSSTSYTNPNGSIIVIDTEEAN